MRAGNVFPDAGRPFGAGGRYKDVAAAGQSLADADGDPDVLNLGERGFVEVLGNYASVPEQAAVGKTVDGFSPAQEVN